MINKDRQRTFFTLLWDRGYNSGSGKTAGLHFFWLSLVKMPKVLHRYPSQNEFLLSQDAPCPKQAIPQNKLTLYRLSKCQNQSYPRIQDAWLRSQWDTSLKILEQGFPATGTKISWRTFRHLGNRSNAWEGVFPPYPPPPIRPAPPQPAIMSNPVWGNPPNWPRLAKILQ